MKKNIVFEKTINSYNDGFIILDLGNIGRTSTNYITQF